jgi:hypothetical protein
MLQLPRRYLADARLSVSIWTTPSSKDTEIPTPSTTRPPHVDGTPETSPRVQRSRRRPVSLDDRTKPGISLLVSLERDRQRDVRRQGFGCAGMRRVYMAPNGDSGGNRSRSVDEQRAALAAIRDLLLWTLGVGTVKFTTEEEARPGKGIRQS